MSESLRDRVARVLYESGGYPEEFLAEHPWESIGEAEQASELAQADALIAIGLVYGVGLDRDRAEFFKRQRDQAWQRIKIMGWALAGTTALSIIGIVELVTS